MANSWNSSKKLVLLKARIRDRNPHLDATADACNVPVNMEHPPTNSDTVTVATFNYRPEAERALLQLEASGIIAALRGDDASGWAPHLGIAGGGIKLIVSKEQEADARALLADLPGMG